ncbi:MAG TPA: NAD(P)-binding domain-containing protein [Oculatellaceae cyanobacterium]
MHIAIIGGGRVGGTLGKRLHALGHHIHYVVRDNRSEKSRQLVSDTGARSIASDSIETERVCGSAEVIILALPWLEVEPSLKLAGDLSGKVVIDATNPIELGPEGLAKGLIIGHTTSGAEQVAQWARNAAIAKAFNTIGTAIMHNPMIDGSKTFLPVCGDASAKAVAMQFAQELGFAAVDAGDLAMARLQEPFGMMWIHLAFFAGLGPEFTFKVVGRGKGF